MFRAAAKIVGIYAHWSQNNKGPLCCPVQHLPAAFRPGWGWAVSPSTPFSLPREVSLQLCDFLDSLGTQEGKGLGLRTPTPW